jgi:outer membrane protein OmpA-like peptidoglycan-associated protein
VAYLETIVTQLKANKAKHFEIIGYTNQLGNHYNQLSIERAKTIYDYLIENGISATKLSCVVVGFDRKLIEEPNMIQEMKKNIRIEIVVRL